MISGYLMCMLLSRKRPITFTNTSDFYYRRIKRIVPLYMFIIFCVLLVVFRDISPIDFMQVIKEAIPALLFYSNVPAVRNVQYFDLVSFFGIKFRNL